MNFKKLAAPSLTDLFVNEIERMIFSGELKIGDKLPSERKLAEAMNVSLAVVNAGIGRLANIGFLSVEPRKGVSVADYTRNGNLDTLVEIMTYTGSPLDRDVLDAVVLFRRGMETAAARLACKNRTEASLAELSEMTQQLETVDTASFPELAYQFHHEVAIASGNICYPMIVQSFKALYVMFYQMQLESIPKEVTIKYAQNILQAIENGDAAAAEAAAAEAIADSDTWISNFTAWRKGFAQLT